MLNPEYDFSWMIAPVTTEEFFSGRNFSGGQRQRLEIARALANS